MRRNICRYCAAPLTETLIDLGRMPVANSFLSGPEAIGEEKSYPLAVMVCGACFLAQVTTDLPADAIFDDEYAYFSSFSDSWVAHAKDYTDVMIGRYALDPKRSFIVEVASNDGYLLQHFVAREFRCLGIEPAANCAAAARAKGVPTDVAFFGTETAKRVVDAHGPASLTAANNVLAHVPVIADFVAGFRDVLAPDGVSTFEFPHLLNLIREVQFDTIYHEHYSYLSLLTVERIFNDQGLAIIDVETLPTHGGSLRAHAVRDDGPRAGQRSVRVDAVVGLEREHSLDTMEGYRAFQQRAEGVRSEFRNSINRLRAEGKTIAAYGAAAKGNTFLNYCGANQQDIPFAVDRNPAKQDVLLPGSHIPVFSPDRIAAEQPDVVLILPWNIADEIVRNLGVIRDWGGRFMVAVPEVKFL